MLTEAVAVSLLAFFQLLLCLSCVAGFMLNLCSVMLRLCEPIFTTQPSDRLAKIDPSYMCSQFSRLDVQNEPCLARGRLSKCSPVLGA